MADFLLAHAPENVLPVLDYGQDADTENYYIVMPVAELSLYDFVRSNGPLPEVDAVTVLAQIARGLASLPEVIHRDLKPENVLLHEGKWKIADFGIARFIEESTSDRTLRGCLSPLYAAPEQWELKPCNHATDIYALGCIAHFLLSGKPPFTDTSREDLRAAHLSKPPPVVRECSAKLRALVGMMLRKSPLVRPDIARVARVLEQVPEAEKDDRTKGDFALLQQAAAKAVEDDARDAADELKRTAVMRERRQLHASSLDILSEAISYIGAELEENVPGLQREHSAQKHMFTLGKGSLVVNVNTYVEPATWEPLPTSGWDVVSVGSVVVNQRSPRDVQLGASLYYAKRKRDTGYRWWEIQFEDNPLLRNARLGSFPIDSPADADAALKPITGRYQVRGTPVPVDDESLDDTCRRWGRWLAAAQLGKLEFRLD